MAGFITGLVVVNGQTDFASGIGAAIQSSPTTDAEHLALANEDYKAVLANNLEKEKLGLEEERNDNADRDSARMAQVKIQESVNASWLAKNIKELLALTVVGCTLSLLGLICFGPELSTTRSQMIIYSTGALLALAGAIINNYFGASHSSAERDKLLLAATPPGTQPPVNK
jgi:hypothetical protein